MRNLFIFITLSIFACKKIDKTPETPITPVVQEESIKFTTNLDTGAYNVSDTLPLTISVSSKLPSVGLIYSITTTWTDSSKQIFKLDSTLSQASLSLNIIGHKKSGNYSLAVTVSSKATPSNSLSKNISFVNNPLGRFQGYKVDNTALTLSKQKDNGKSYWMNVGIPGDLLTAAFQSTVGFFSQISFGDFNNDGWIDIFNPGSRYQITLSYSTFLIWNPSTKTFDKKNLYNNPSDSIFGGNKHHSKPIYLNNDNYVDFIVFDNGDEGIQNSPNEPIRIVLSDGKGKYDLKEIATNENEVAQWTNNKGGGDVGDLNEDRIPDLVITTSGHVYIYWGIKDFPFFRQSGRACFLTDVYNPVFAHQNDNGFGEQTFKCGNANGAVIADIDKDGKNDILLYVEENPNSQPIPRYNKILTNLGLGRFNDNSVIELPLYGSTYVLGEDFIIDDINGDNLNDIICLNHTNFLNWNFYTYIQQIDKTFKVDITPIVYIINKFTPRGGQAKFISFYQDINGDGKKDIGYYENANNKNQFINKTIFVRIGNQFIEQDYYQFDLFAKNLLPKVN